ncbi:MAG: transaldolase [Acidimicrobiales bacterium]|nr:MAG: transaldolase [Acidimicrobiales bacterium]
MTKLNELFDSQGQSPWIDNLKRSYLTDGKLAEMVQQGVRGVTSNPTIFAKAIQAGTDYDEQFSALTATKNVDDAYWDLVVQDIRGALSVLRPVHDSSGGADGFVSLEVAPDLAHDTDATIEAARSLNQRIDEPNLFVKIPATAEGVPAIRAMIGEARSINVTLIFSVERYGDVIEAYQAGLEDLVARDPEADLSKVTSVASFFVSRVDTEVDRRLENMADGGTSPAGADVGELRGKAAVAQAKLAYQLFEERFAGPRWEALSARGAHLQRPLWASTSTKNPDYPDLLYVDSLIGPHTVNTMPDATLDAFLDHGTVKRTIDQGVAEAKAAMEDLAAAGIDMEDVSLTLENEGVAAFAKSFDELIQSLSDKANALHAQE